MNPHSAVPPNAAPARMAPGETPEPARPVLRVLVVDDNKDAGESLGILLRLRGLEVRVAYDGPSALRILPEVRPDVVLLDLGMPKMDGYAVAEEIRRHPEFRTVTLVAITGWGHAEFRRRSRDTGFDHHLVKPVEVESLVTLLHSSAAGGNP